MIIPVIILLTAGALVMLAGGLIRAQAPRAAEVCHRCGRICDELGQSHETLPPAPDVILTFTVCADCQADHRKLIQ